MFTFDHAIVIEYQMCARIMYQISSKSDDLSLRYLTLLKMADIRHFEFYGSNKKMGSLKSPRRSSCRSSI